MGMKRFYYIMILCLMMALSFYKFSSCVYAEGNDYPVENAEEKEPNDELKEANVIELDKVYNCSIGNGDNSDNFRVELTKDETYKIALGGISVNDNLWLSVRDLEGNDVKVNGSFMPRVIYILVDSNDMYYAVFTASVTGKYCIEFSSFNKDKKDYYFYIKETEKSNKSNRYSYEKIDGVSVPSPKEVEDETGFNDELKGSKIININRKFNCSFNKEDLADYYRFELEEDKSYKFAVDGIGQKDNISIYIRDPEGVDVQSVRGAVTLSIYLSIDDENMYYFTFKSSMSGMYYVEFSNYQKIDKDYSFYIKEITGNNKDYSNEWVDGEWYNDDGSQNYTETLSWKSNSSGWWVEDTSGWYPQDSWQKIDGIWYYFKPDGYMAAGEYYGGYWFNDDGSWDKNYFLCWMSNSTGWWVEDKSGWYPSSSWLKINGSWYYFDTSGYMVTNQYIDGYWIGSDGVCQ